MRAEKAVSHFACHRSPKFISDRDRLLQRGAVLCAVPTRVARGRLRGANEGMIYYGLPGPFDGSVEESVFDAVRAVMQAAGAREWRRSN